MQAVSRIWEAKKLMNTVGVRTPWELVQAGSYLAKTVWNPATTDVGYGVNHFINRALRELDPERGEALVRQDPGMAQLYAEKYDPELSPQRLAQLPDGTLGREYARFIQQNKIDPLGTLLSMGEPANILQYMFKRAYKLHDILHVALGCDASILGEVRIVSYSLGQRGSDLGIVSRAPAMALAVLMMNIGLRNPADMREAVHLAAQWLQYGERAPSHTSIRFEDYVDRPVETVRAMVLAD